MSKRKWHHPETPTDESTVAWRSVGQLEDTPQFREWMDREFPRGAAEMRDEDDAEVSRRSFLKLMGASTALAGFGMSACRQPESYILPYAQAPEWVIPGKATYYATSFPSAHGATPLVVTSFEGRPTKLAPNKTHPDKLGTGAFIQASILDLYSPSRSQQVMKSGKPSNRAEVGSVLTDLAAYTTAKLGVVVGRDDSPTRQRMLAELKEKFPNAKIFAYEPLEGEAHKVTGAGRRFVVDFEKADRVVALDCDFLDLDPVGPTAAFFDRRKPEGRGYEAAPDASKMNRLYAIESAFSLTGGMADHRLRIKPSELTKVAAQLLSELGETSVANGLGMSDARITRWVKELAKDLQQSSGRVAVVAGSRAPEAVHHLAAAINAKLGSLGEGKPVRMVETGQDEVGDLAQLNEDLYAGAVEHVVLMTPGNPVYDAPADMDFAAALAKAKTSIHLGMRTDATAHACDWHIPASHYLEGWSDARTATGSYTVVQPMILPLYPECVSELEVLAALLSDDSTLISGEGPEGEASPAHDAVRATYHAMAGRDDDAAWRTFLRDGFLDGSSYEPVAFTPDMEMVKKVVAAAPRPSDSLEIIFATDGSIYDGRWIDNGWLQEAPDPISKISWDNAALIAPKTAQRLGLYDELVTLETDTAAIPPDGEGEKRTGKLVKLVVNGVTLEVPLQIGFGQAEDTIILSLGYGQGFDDEDELDRGPKNAQHVGQVGVNSGFNAYPLRTSKTPYYATLDGMPKKTGKRYQIAAVQDHHSMYGRALAREISTAKDEKKGDFDTQLAKVKKQGMDSHMPENVSLYKSEDRDGKPLLSDKVHQWAMAIDLTACTGCNACLVACQAENNIPIVGKKQVAMGREMHWIRMDRYFAAQETEVNGEKVVDEENLAMIPQPVACVQCESAPCETVCPVNATVHTEDGLNAMAYNRCIGTRYCANNCPYKARRFNFFDYNKRNPLVANNLYRGPLGEKQVGEAPHLQRNPNVSVRMRGVMEKCTYCVQRLKDATIRQNRRQKQEALATGDSTEHNTSISERRIPVDSVKVACQEACAAGAITFGNMLDGDQSQMMRAKGLERNYDLLNYIGTRPRTSYLARVKNPNPDMPGADLVGKATIHMH